MSDGSNIRVACVGAGAWGKNLVRNFHALGALARVVDPDEDARGRIAEAHPDIPVGDDFAEVLADPGIAAVAIATPAETHGEMVRSGLLAGKDVFVEKPLCLSGTEGRELVDLARDSGRVLMVGHLLWYHPAVLALRDLVETGELGQLRYIYSNRLNLGKIRREENILWSFAPHDVSVVLGLLGEMPDGIEAWGGNYLHEQIADVTVSVLSFSSGVKAHIFVSWLHPFKEQKLIVVGDRKMAVFDDTEPEEKLRLYPYSIEWKNRAPIPRKEESEVVAVDPVEPLRAECSHFLECVETRAVPRTDGEEALRVLQVLESCQAKLGRVERTNGTRPNRDGGPFVHESSYVDEDVRIGDGTTIWHFSHILRDSRIGADCRIGQNVVIGPNVDVGDGVKIQNNVSVYEGVTLEDHVFCGPSMVFTNVYNPRSEIRRMDELRPTLVRRGATLGANCTVLCGVTVGRYAFIGAGAVVLDDVPEHALVVGNPGRVVGWMCECGSRIDVDDAGQGACRACDLTYRETSDGIEPA